MKKVFSVLLAMVLLAGMNLSVVQAAKASDPHIYVDFAPPYQAGNSVQGHVYFDGAAGNFSKYAVTMYLEVTPGGQVWGPKPTFAQPSVKLDDSGNFSCMFNTGGSDYSAQVLYVCLIPASYEPDASFEQTKENAYEVVTIKRTPSGKVSINHKKEKEKTEATQPAPGAVGFDKSMKASLKSPTDTAKLSLCYSPYIGGLSPEKNDKVPLETMKNLLDTISPYADTVRLFGCTGELEKIYPVLKAAPYKKRVIGGCWFDARYSEKQIQNELDTLIKLTNEGYIDIAVVGSENLHRSDFSAAQMIEYIDYVRAGIKDKSIPVTTSDTASALLANPQVIEHCNVVLFTQYSYYEKIDVSQSVKSLQNSYDALKALAGEKPIIVSETGFPTSGSTNGKAVPSMKNAKVFADAVYDWSRKSNIEVVLFSSVDEAYKKANGDVEDHFGIFTADGEAKSAYKDLLAKSK